MAHLQKGNNHQENECKNEEIVKSKTNLIVNYLPSSITPARLKSLFSKYGSIKNCKIVTEKYSEKSLGYGFVNFWKPEDAKKAIDTINGLRLENKVLKISYARLRTHDIRNTNLFVSGFPKNIPSEELHKLFNRYGQVVSLNIIFDNISPQQYNVNDGNILSKGICFVRYNKYWEACNAIHALNGFQPSGFTQPLVVKVFNKHTRNCDGAMGYSNPTMVGPVRYITDYSNRFWNGEWMNM